MSVPKVDKAPVVRDTTGVPESPQSGEPSPEGNEFEKVMDSEVKSSEEISLKAEKIQKSEESKKDVSESEEDLETDLKELDSLVEANALVVDNDLIAQEAIQVSAVIDTLINPNLSQMSEDFSTVHEDTLSSVEILKDNDAGTLSLVVNSPLNSPLENSAQIKVSQGKDVSSKSLAKWVSFEKEAVEGDASLSQATEGPIFNTNIASSKTEKSKFNLGQSREEALSFKSNVEVEGVVGSLRGDGVRGFTYQSPINTLESRNISVPEIKKVSAARVIDSTEVRSISAQVKEALSPHIREGKNEMTIRLDPPEWGHIQVKVRMSDNEVHINFVTEHHFVKEALDRGVNQLRQTLAGDGLNLGNVNVGVGQEQTWKDQSGSEEFLYEDVDEVKVLNTPKASLFSSPHLLSGKKSILDALV